MYRRPLLFLLPRAQKTLYLTLEWALLIALTEHVPSLGPVAELAKSSFDKICPVLTKYILITEGYVCALGAGSWEAPQEGETPPVFTDMEKCPAWARNYDCFNAEGFKSMPAESQAQFQAEAAKVKSPSETCFLELHIFGAAKGLERCERI
jgi:hypothetical protein